MKNLPSTDFNETLTPGNARAALKDAGATRAEGFMLDIDEIMVLEGFNPRVIGADYSKHVDQIADSILANGFLPGKPLTVHAVTETPEEGSEPVTVFYVVDGHTRLAAARKAIEKGAEIKTLPVVLTPAGTSLADLTIQTVLNNNTTKPLSPIELAVVVKRLTNYNVEKAEIARRLSITPRYIDDLMLLLGAPSVIQEAVRSGKVSATLAVQEIRQHGDKAAERVKTAVAAAGDKKVTAKKMPKAPAKSVTTGKAKAKAKEKVKKALAKAAGKAETPKAAKPKADDAPGLPASDTDFWKGAVECALAMPKKAGAGLEFLAKFVAEDATVIAEVERWLGQKPGAFFDATLRGPVDKDGI